MINYNDELIFSKKVRKCLTFDPFLSISTDSHINKIKQDLRNESNKEYIKALNTQIKLGEIIIKLFKNKN